MGVMEDPNHPSTPPPSGCSPAPSRCLPPCPLPVRQTRTRDERGPPLAPPPGLFAIWAELAGALRDRVRTQVPPLPSCPVGRPPQRIRGRSRRRLLILYLHRDPIRDPGFEEGRIDRQPLPAPPPKPVVRGSQGLRPGLAWLQMRLTTGWGIARVAFGMALGDWAYGSTKALLTARRPPLRPLPPPAPRPPFCRRHCSLENSLVYRLFFWRGQVRV